MSSRNFFVVVALAAALVGGMTAGRALATDSTWNVNNSGNWSTATNWTGSAVPNAVDDIARLTFSINANRTVTLTADVTVAQLYLYDNDKQFIVAGASPRTLTIDGTANAALISSSGYSHQITVANLSLADATEITVAANTLSITSAISGSETITKTGAGTLSLAPAVANTFTGNVAVNAGILAITKATALGTTDGTTTVAGAAALKLSGTITVAEDVTISGTGVASTGALESTANNNIWSGDVTLGADSSIGVTTAATTLEISGVIDDGDGTYNLTKVGAGTLVLSNTNTYGGTTTITAGYLRAVEGTGLGGGNLVLDGGVQIGRAHV